MVEPLLATYNAKGEVLDINLNARTFLYRKDWRNGTKALTLRAVKGSFVKLHPDSHRATLHYWGPSKERRSILIGLEAGQKIEEFEEIWQPHPKVNRPRRAKIFVTALRTGRTTQTGYQIFTADGSWESAYRNRVMDESWCPGKMTAEVILEALRETKAEKRTILYYPAESHMSVQECLKQDEFRKPLQRALENPGRQIRPDRTRDNRPSQRMEMLTARLIQMAEER